MINICITSCVDGTQIQNKAKKNFFYKVKNNKYHIKN